MAGIKDGVLYGEFLVEGEESYCFIAINKISASFWNSPREGVDVFYLDYSIIADGVKYTLADKVSPQASKELNSVIDEIIKCNSLGDGSRLMEIYAYFSTSNGTIRAIERE